MLRVLLTAHVSFAVLVWLVVLVLTAAILAGIAIWGHVEQSAWHYPASQLLRWLVFGLALDTISTYLRLHIAHGRTRRDFLRQLWPYLLGLATTLAVLVTIGYLVERGVYALAGWSPALTNPTMFKSTGNVPGLIGAYTFMFLLWAIACTMVAAAFTRNFLLGLITVPAGVLIVSPGEFVAGTTGVPLLDNVQEALNLPAGTSIVLGLAAIVLGCLAIWGIMRDMPVRPRVA